MKANAQFNPYYMKRCIRPVLKIHKAYRSYNEKKTTNQNQKKNPKTKQKKTPKNQTKTNNNPQKTPNQKKTRRNLSNK